MPDSPSITRRQALAATGVAASGVGGYVAGVRTSDDAPTWLAGRNCSLSPLAVNPTDWSFSRHDRANTGYAPASAAPDWPLTPVWELEWPVRPVHGTSPLVVSDGVVVTLLEAAMGNAVLGISLADGGVRWHRQAGSVSYAQPSVGGTAFTVAEVPDADVRFAARSLVDGTALWTGSFTSNAPPTLVGGRLLAFDHSSTGDDHFAVVALDARTGVQCWRAVFRGRPTDAAVADGRVVVATRYRGLLVLDAASGEREWFSVAGGDEVAVLDGRVISSQPSGNLRAFSLADGSLEWTVRSEHPRETDEAGQQNTRPGFDIGAVTSERVVYELVGDGDYSRRVQARDFTSGELLWDVGRAETSGPYHDYSPPIVVGEDVLVVRSTSLEGSENPPDVLLRLDVATGVERDRTTFGAEEHVLHHPVVANGYLLVPTDQRLVAFA